MADFHWKWLVLAAMLCSTVGFMADRCSRAQVEVAKEKANTTRDWNLGLGKRKD